MCPQRHSPGVMGMAAGLLVSHIVDHGVSITGRGVPAVVMAVTVMVMVTGMVMAAALLVSHIINRGVIDNASSSASRTALEALV
jgi:hypothetical protein